MYTFEMRNKRWCGVERLKNQQMHTTHTVRFAFNFLLFYLQIRIYIQFCYLECLTLKWQQMPSVVLGCDGRILLIRKPKKYGKFTLNKRKKNNKPMYKSHSWLPWLPERLTTNQPKVTTIVWKNFQVLYPIIGAKQWMRFRKDISQFH